MSWPAIRRGEKATSRELGALIKARGLAGVVAIVGHCADMPAAIVAASVVATPSTEPEAFGRVAVEAEAMGAPVVVSDLGGAKETVLAPPDCEPAERTGWRVPPANPEALADAIGEMLALGASARASLARRARNFVEEKYALDQMTRATLQIYARLIFAER